MWRPQMQTFLMRAGIEERDYAREIPSWRELSAAVAADAEAEEQAAFALLLGSGASGSSSIKGAAATPTVRREAADAEQHTAAKKRAAEAISRSRRAYGLLYQALPADLRALVADVPQGYAYGIWSFLEKRYRSTEQDSVMTLWKQFTTLAQEVDEDFVTYKARVDSALELLHSAKQKPPAGLYASLLLWNLQPRYATAVLTLKTSERLKDADKIDWPGVVQYVEEFERSQQQLGETAGEGERAMAARNAMPASVKRADVKCFNCDKKGHFARDCKQPRRRPHRQGQSQRSSRAPAGKGSGTESESDRDEGAQNQRLNATRQSNRYSALSGNDYDDEDEAPAVKPRARQQQPALVEHSYLSRVLAGIDVQKKTSSPEPPRPPPVLKRLRRPGENAPAPTPSQRAPPREKEKPPSRVAKSLDVALKTTSQAVDTGASCSSTGTRDMLVNIRRCPPMPIKVADGAVVVCNHKGEMPLRLPIEGQPDKYVRVTIPDVYYHERFDANLLSWGVMREAGWELHSTEMDGTHVITPGGKKIVASTRGRLTILDSGAPERVYAARFGRFVCATASDLVQLHQRLGHVSWKRLLRMCKTGATHGVGSVSDLLAAELQKAEKEVLGCTACAEAKGHRNALGHRGLDKGTTRGEVLHMDTFHAVTRDPTTNAKQTRYCLLVTDGYSEWRWASVHAHKTDLAQSSINIIRNCRTMTGRNPRLIVSDLGSEFDNRTLKDYCRQHGITLQPSPPRAKELNGLAEKSVDTTKNHVRAMLLAARVPEHTGWMHAVLHHVYLWNRTHIGRHSGRTPHEEMTGREPSIVNVGVFGCDAYVHQDRTQRDTTFSRKAEPAIYLGHSGRENCPVVRMLRSGKVITAKDVVFNEDSFKHMRALRRGREGDIGSVDLDDIALNAGEQRTLQPCSSSPQSVDATATDEDDVDNGGDVEDDEDAEYEVESITGEQLRQGKLQYRVRWKGYDEETWESAVNLKDTVALDAWEKQRTEARLIQSDRTLRSHAKTSVVVPSKDEDDEKYPVPLAAARDVAAQRV